MKDLLLLCPIRQYSSRCKLKMIKQFHNTTLTDIVLSKLEYIKKYNNTFEDITVAICRKDKELYDIASKYNIKITDRNEKSVKTATKTNDINYYLSGFKQNYVVWINGSAPFTTISNIIEVSNQFKNGDMESIHLIKERKNWFWKNNQPLNLELGKTRTQEIIPIYESIHTFYGYNRKYMLNTGSYWNLQYNNPYLLLQKESIENMDIDTDLDFKICEKIYKEIHETKDCS